MFLRMMIINDLHIRVICMLIVWIYYLNVSSNFLSLIKCYRQYATTLSNEVNFISKVT